MASNPLSGVSAITSHIPQPSFLCSHTPICCKLGPMRVFGIDCGTEITGYRVVETCDTGRELRIVCKTMGEIRLLKTESTSQRLEHVYRELTAQLEIWQ